MRKLVLESGTWEFKVGRGFVQIVSPSGKRHVRDIPKVKGITWDDFERGHWKKTSDAALTPGEIRTYIEKNIGDLP